MTFEDGDSYSIGLMTFVSYMASPENGLEGTIGMAWSQYNLDYNFMH